MSFSVSPSQRRAGRLIALAALAVTGAAHAQSSVQAYGLIDLSAGQFQAAGAAKDKSVQSGEMSTSYLGFKGSEDLGGGLSAKFAIETFFTANNGGAGRGSWDHSFWARNAYVGLSGDFGTLTMGRNTTSLFVSTLIFNAFGDSFGFSPVIQQYFSDFVPGTFSNYVSGDTGWSQSISYSTPNFSGLSGQLQVSGNGANADGSTNGRKVGGNVLYFSGPFAGTVAYQKVDAGTADATTTYQVGASYDFGVAKLYGQYGKVKDDTLSNAYKLSDIGLSVPLGGGKVLLQYGHLVPDAGASRTTVSAGYDYTLSKRTDVYGVAMNDKLTGANSGNTFALGLRHTF